MTIYNTPVVIYHKVMEDGSISPALHKRGKFTQRVIKVCFERIWDRITSKLIDEFGVSTDAELLFYKQNTINRCELEMLNGGENHETLILILNSEKELIKNRIEGKTVKDIRKHHAKLYRGLEQKYNRDPKKLTIFEFYNDLRDWEKEAVEEKSIGKDTPKRLQGNG